MNEKTVIKQRIIVKDRKLHEKMPCLVVVEGAGIGEVYRIEKDSVVLGRDPKSDIMIWEEGVSRSHARIEHNDEGYFIVDLESTNGTYVNSTKVQKAAIHEGDKIGVGDVLLRFTVQDAIDVSHQEYMREMALRDPLTKIYNRRYFMDVMFREINYTVRIHQPLSVIMIDLDYFKQINDKHGHPAGDKILQTVAQRISRELRVYDTFARYGGEEFIIMLRSTALENALMLAERLRKLVESLDIVYEGKTIPTTISLGVATLNPEQAVGVEELIKEADQYLYMSKQNGRNQISSAKS